MSLFNELKRRNVVKVTIAYIVMAWLVMQVADVVLNNIEAPGWVFSVIMLLVGLGLPFAILFSWAFELTPEGLKLEKNIDRSQSITHETGRKLDFIIIGVLVVALGYFAIDKFVLDASRDAALVEATTQAVAEQVAAEAVPAESDKSIAVLPFVNMSDDASNEFFSDGLSEELLNLLAKVPELRVAARTSSFSLKDKELQIAEIGEILKVANVLEGSVRKAGNQVRITAQLIHVEDGYHLWSETYDRSLDNIFNIQDEIAAEVVSQLKVTLLGEAPKAEVVDPEAYSLYLQARHLGRLFNREAFERSNASYKEALAISPDYSAAYSGLAQNYTNQGSQGYLPVNEALRLAREASRQALLTDPQNGHAYAGLGWVAMIFDNDLPTAAEHFTKALSLEPESLQIIGNAAVMALTLGRLDEAIMLLEYVAARDPVNTKTFNNLSLMYLFTGQPDKAIAAAQTALQLSPGRPGANGTISWAYVVKGEAGLALENIANEPHEYEQDWVTAMALYSLGRTAEFEAALAAFPERWGADQPGYVAGVYAWSGHVDEAFLWLDHAVKSNDPLVGLINFDPTFSKLHDDSRWPLFLESIGKSPTQLDAIDFNVALPE